MKILELTNTAQGYKQSILRYFSPIYNSPKKTKIKKILNALRAERERRAKKDYVKSKPFILHFEATNICNLRCPNCKTGLGLQTLPKGYLSLKNYKKVIDELKDYLVLTRLDGTGESLLNKEFWDIVEYSTKNNIVSSVSTNFAKIEKKDIKKIIETGLDYIIISLDGADKETYEKYRVGATFENVISNIKELVKLKKEMKSKIPFIEIQFIAFKEIAHQKSKIINLGKELNIDRVFIKEADSKKIHALQKKEGTSSPCYWLWHVLNTSWTGDMKACCISGLSSTFSFGNVVNNPVIEEWNNENMVNIRKLFSEQSDEIIEKLENCNCLNCYKLNIK